MDEYVIVEQMEEIREDDRSKEFERGSKVDDGDDASYDYCEDAFPDGEDDDDDDGENSVAEAAQKDSFMLSVPSGLMKDLDEAHAAAKLACSCLEEEVPTDESSPTDGIEYVKETSKPVDNKASSIDLLKNTTPARKAKVQDKDATTQGATSTNLSRASNKKRRKQLKLMKKAQAATSAAQVLSARAAATAKGIKGKKVAASPSSSNLSSRKVANLAVACARETMASYRNEVQLF